MLASVLRRNWELLLLLLIGLFQYASGHALGSASRMGSDYFLIAILVAALAHFHRHIVPLLLPLWLVIIGYCIAVPPLGGSCDVLVLMPWLCLPWSRLDRCLCCTIF